MARDGMSSLLTRFRRLVDDAGTAVWTDNQLQDVLDEHKFRIQREPLGMEKTLLSSSSYEYRVFHSRFGNYEGGGSATFQVEDTSGSQRGTAAYTADYINGIVTMTADQAGTALYLTAWSYDLNAGAAQCWRERATKVSSYYDVQADGHNISRSQWFRHCLDTAKLYEAQSKPITVRMWRNGLFDDN